ncbi:MAG: DUF805 domain-containing protein [Elusimicrobiaceae bacterium]|nr:DUF805 domain-containing protein [Elusimicrobiaceae bacterium]
MKTYFLDVLKNHYADFSGRATRKEFWMFMLMTAIISIVLGIICVMFLQEQTANIVCAIYNLALLLPYWSIGARRLRDGGFSPWLLLVIFVPFIGFIALIVLFMQPSK